MESDHEQMLVTVCISFLILLLAIAWWHLRKLRKRVPPLPPGPRGLPLIGNLLFLDTEIHRFFTDLAKSYGPIFKLQLGRKLCVVVSSPSIAKELLKDHDVVFANRDVPTTAKAMTYGGIDIAWLPHCPEWRMLRKICSRDMMSNPVLDAYSGLRLREVGEMARHLQGKVGTPVDIGELMSSTTLDVLMSMMWGGQVTMDEEETEKVRRECCQMTREALDLWGIPNISDLFPVLAPLDLQGLSRKAGKVFSWFDRVLESVMNKRLIWEETGRVVDEEKSDFLQLLLQLRKKEESLTLNHIKVLFMEIILAGTDTTSTTLEWAMAVLMKHPKIMKKAQEELEEVVGMNNVVEDHHLPQLHFVRAILMETLRLYPAGALLLPRTPTQSSTIAGYTIPMGARVLVNVWAIHRDPESWENPTEFNPDRFLMATGKWDSIGNDFRYIPFGSGRRKCVGVAMAERMLIHVFATLLHLFEWKLPEGTNVDLTEKFGQVLKKAIPLVVIPTTRLNPNLYSQK